MTVTVYLGFEPGTTNEIPRPIRPANDDVEPSAYIPKGMTEKDRKSLRNAGLEWTDTLGMVKGGVVGWAAEKHDQINGGPGMNKYARAGKNISHFRHGDGAAVDLEESEIDDLKSQTTLFSSVERDFLQLIAKEMETLGVGRRRHYLAMNGDRDSPNRGTPWFGAYATKGTGWYYAMGGFMIAYGAIAVRRKNLVAIWYRSYVYDRYNWDLGKSVDVPTTHLSFLLDDEVMGQVSGIKAPDGLPYFSSGKNKTGRDGEVSGYEIGSKYIPADALLGALEESGDATRYDINGVGRLQYVSIPAKENS